MPVEAEQHSDLQVPLFDGTPGRNSGSGAAFPDGLTSTCVRLPSSPTRKLETELSPALVVNKNRRSGIRITLPAPSKSFGALSWPLIGLKVPDPAAPVKTRSTSVSVPFAER